MKLNDDTLELFKSELLCFADSEWVLGHWYIICMLNGKELTDFTSIAGIAEEKLGETRALFSFLEEYLGMPELQLEFGRDPDQVHAMELLDAPPQNWADFISTLFIAEKALWRYCSTFKGGKFNAVSNLMQKSAEESYFHQLCIDGWLKGLSEDEKTRVADALQTRLSQAVAWFGTEEQSENDPLLDLGIRTLSVWASRTAFIKDIQDKLLPVAGLETDTLDNFIVDDKAKTLDLLTRRSKGLAIPSSLWEHMIPTSPEAEMARRPLAVSIKDSIDLFQTARKDETEPAF